MGIFDYFRKSPKISLHPSTALNNTATRIGEQVGTTAEDSATTAVAAAREAHAARQIDLGNALEDRGRPDLALPHYAEAIEQMPDMARAHLNLGNALLATGQGLAALKAYTKAIELRPGYAAAYYNMGNAHVQLGDHASALTLFEQALLLNPEFVDAAFALGAARDELGDLDGAATSYLQALTHAPGHAEILFNLGGVLQKLGDPKALTIFRAATGGRADFAAAMAQVHMLAGQACDWSQYHDEERALHDMTVRKVASGAPFVLLGVAESSPDGGVLQRNAGALHAESTLGAILTSLPLVDPAMRRSSGGGRLRIGYLSADFHEHATMHLFQGVLTAHDRSRFAIHCYSIGTTNDSMTARVRASCETFRDLAGISDADSAALIAGDNIDLLIDLKGYTTNARPGITARRPAPVIVNWLGYPGTLGHPRLADYLIGDGIVTPPEHASQFSETLALLPHCYQPNDGLRSLAPSPGRQAEGLPESSFVFCSFNQGYKFNPESFTLWCRLLAEVPGSVLWLMPASHEGTVNLRREAQDRGIDPCRLIFATPQPQAAHLARLQCADLALDTFPYNSHTTGSDALWAGVPLVTRMGQTFVSRVAASLLHAVGLPELITRDPDAYFLTARSIALNPARLTQLRSTLTASRQSSPLFSTQRFTRDLEHLYERIQSQQDFGHRALIDLRDTST